MELLIAKGGSDVDRNYTTYFNDMSDEERDAERQTVPILFEDFSSRIKEENNGTRNSVCSQFTPLRNKLLCQLFRALRYQWISAKMAIEKKSKSWGPFWSYQQNSTANSAHLAQFLR